MIKKTAFVAMKFDSSHSLDKRYNIIKEVSEEAGYKTIRADEIKTSGPIVEEICKYLTNCELVIIDTTEDSNSVSYELGYCHGNGRPSSELLLLRKGIENDIPFNYRHYRHRIYRDLNQLRRLMRDWFNITTPLSDQLSGYVFNFVSNLFINNYQDIIVKAILLALKQLKFSGRMEYYVEDLSGSNFIEYHLGLGLKFIRKSKSFKEWNDWENFINSVMHYIKQTNSNLGLSLTSELAEMSAIRYWNKFEFAYEFSEGEPIVLLHISQKEKEKYKKNMDKLEGCIDLKVKSDSNYDENDELPF